MKTVNVYTIDHDTLWKGAEVSSYGLQNGYIDFNCLANAIGACILNNTIINKADDFELVNGCDYDPETDEYISDNVYQWYIVSGNAVDILEGTNELLYYSDELDLYLWGITHYGTSWEYVLTDIKINKEG